VRRVANAWMAACSCGCDIHLMRAPEALRCRSQAADVRPDWSQHTKAAGTRRGSSSLDRTRRGGSQAGLAAPHGPTIQTRVDISGGQTATVIKTANNVMVSVIAV
jgi:hypothetical protein